MDKFETWWEHEGQEFLYALNTTTDDDIKLVAEIAWKNGAYCAEQAEQEPVIRATLAPPAPPEVYQMRSKDAYEAGWWEAQRQKAVSPIAPVKQAEQEPVSWIYEDELPKGYPYDEMFSRSKIIEGVRMFPEVQTEQSTVKDSLTAQEPVCVVEITYGREPECYVTGNIDDFPEGVFKLYAAPVRTKDLTDDELDIFVSEKTMDMRMTLREFARAVIAADREKNK